VWQVAVRWYSYDALDRLTALAGAGATEGYGYNGDGTLVTQTVNVVPTRYTQDLAAGQSQVLQTATGAGTPTVTDYLYGLDRLAAVPSGGTARTWYMPDLQGSVRYTTDDGANASPAVNYDPYGTPEGGATPPTFGYDGELQGAATGLQYLRARTYNPVTGQFLTRDPLEQQTGQAYLYASGDPVNASDPSGDCTVRGGTLRGIGSSGACTPRDLARVISDITHGRGGPGYGPQSPANEQCLALQILRLSGGKAPLHTYGYTPAPQLMGGAAIGLGVGADGAIDIAAIGLGADAVLAGAVAAAPVVLGVVVIGGATYLAERYIPRNIYTPQAGPDPCLVRTCVEQGTVPLAPTIPAAIPQARYYPIPLSSSRAIPDTENRRRNYETVYHYTDQAGAEGIYATRKAFVTPKYRGPTFTYPPGFYGSIIPPIPGPYTQKQLSARFYGGNEKKDVSWFVEFSTEDDPFIEPGSIDYPDFRYIPGPPGGEVAVHPLLIGKSAIAL